MAARHEVLTEAPPDYIFKLGGSEELDKEAILTCLGEGWRVESSPDSSEVSFNNPNYKLLVVIKSNKPLASLATVRRYGYPPGNSTTNSAEIIIDDVRSIVTQVQSTGNCLGLHSPDGSFYITRTAQESPYLPAYTINELVGRNPDRVPNWRDWLPFFRLPIPRLHLAIKIPRLDSVS